ncbi:unnamed protein product [Citrullus colocynthis]|uniref:Uncharacterized protein n=1 Tax=Citrullus colocynthis TaxID=252529 RepID=A0ABP0XUG9_9ROSI
MYCCTMEERDWGYNRRNCGPVVLLLKTTIELKATFYFYFYFFYGINKERERRGAGEERDLGLALSIRRKIGRFKEDRQRQPSATWTAREITEFAAFTLFKTPLPSSTIQTTDTLSITVIICAVKSVDQFEVDADVTLLLQL